MGNEFIGRNRVESEGLLFDKGQISEWAGFAFSALRRRKVFAAGVTALFLLAAFAIHHAQYPKYVASTRLLAMPTEGTPGTVAAEGTSSQSRLANAAAQVILSRASLEQMARNLRLHDQWSASQPKLLQYKSTLVGRTGAAATEAELLEEVVGELTTRLQVTVEDDSVLITVAWPNPKQAAQIVEAAKDQLLLARQQAELAPLEEREKTLKAQLQTAQGVVDTEIAALEAQTLKKRKGAKSATVKGLQAQGRWGAMPDPRLLQLRTQLLAKRKAISDLEDTRRRRMSELNALLTEQKASLGPDHPTLATTAEKLESLKRGAPEVDALRAEENVLLSEFVQLGGKDTDLSADPGPLWPTELNDDPRLHYARTRVELALQNLQALLRDSSEAEVSVATARASFPQRYAVIEPTTTPKSSAATSPWMLAIGAVLAAFSVSVAGAVLLDLASGRLHEAWQVKRWVGVQVLGEVPQIRKPVPLKIADGPKV